jgi:replicative DNA helicase
MPETERCLMSTLKQFDNLAVSRSLPIAHDAERMILGCIILDNDLLAEASAKLQPEDFFQESHRIIFRAMLRLATRREGIDPITMKPEIGVDDMRRIGGEVFLASLFDGCPRFSSIDSYIQQVRRAAIRRDLIRASYTIADEAYSGEDLAEEVLSKANQRLSLIDSHRSASKLLTASEAGWTRLQEIENFQSSGRAILGIGTGIYDLDRLTGGLIPGDQHLLCARPSMGKTALSIRLLDGVATSGYNQDPVQVFFTAEMATSQIMDRWLFGKARVDQMRLRTNRLTQDDYRQLTTAQQAIAAADSQKPDVVVLALEMARHNSIEFLYEFKSYSEWQNVPVLLLVPRLNHDIADNPSIRNNLGVCEVLIRSQLTLRRLCDAVARAGQTVA